MASHSLKDLALKRVVITSGDPDGIGFEVAAKALIALGPKRNFQFFLFLSKNADQKLRKKLHRNFQLESFSSLSEALQKATVHYQTLVEIISPLEAPIWVEQAAKACLEREFQALVTAPLSKTSINAIGLKDLGHTEILKRLSQRKSLHMGFIGDEFNVVLVTDHLALKDSAKQLGPEKLFSALEAALSLKKILKDPRPIALLGLNPHAGESGLLGQEEQKILLPFVKQARAKGIKISEPLPPDTAFLEKNWRAYSCFLAMYHDQGLIPFKLVHGFDSGVHVTLGLPFVRTSVDHGTAKDLFGKNKANASSMLLAIKTAMQMISK